MTMQEQEVETETKRELYTNSRSACFQRCRREHLYKYERGIRPRRKAKALSVGSIVHDGVEVWRVSMMDVKHDTPDVVVLDAALGAVESSYHSNDADAEVDEFDLVRAEEMIRGYHYRWFYSDRKSVEYVFVEEQFQTRLINPETGRPSRTFDLAGKIDAGGRVKIGERIGNFIFETKTSGVDISDGSDYWVRLRMDGQISTYYRGAESFRFEPEGCIYDVLKKPGIKPAKATPEENRKFTKDKVCADCKAKWKAIDKKMKVADMLMTAGCETCEPSRLYSNMRDTDETPEEFRVRVREVIADAPEEYYRRGTVVRLEEELAEFDADAWLTAGTMRDAKRMGCHPRNPNACLRFNRLCEFFDVCTGVAGIDDDSRFAKGPKHPELDLDEPAQSAAEPF